MIGRLAIRLACSREPSHRYRRAALPPAAGVATLLLLAATSLLAMAERETERFEQRTAALAQQPRASDLLWLERTDEAGRRQYSVVWLEPAGGARPVLPPGLRRLPRPGRAALSPALHDLAQRERAIAARYPGHALIGPEGTRDRDELLAYVRPGAGRSFAHHRAAVRIAGFGPTGAPAVTTATAPATERGAVLKGALAFLGVPALLLTLAGVATASHARDLRFAVLRAIGAAQPTVARLAMLETIALAAVGVLPACVLWIAVSGTLDEVTGVGHRVYTGDLGLSGPVVGAVAAVELAACALIAAVLSRTLGQPSQRPVAPPGPASGRRAVPLGLSLGATVAGSVLGSDVGGTVMLLGFIAALISLPPAAPTLLPAVGAALARGRSVAALLAGRRLQWDPRRTARPFGIYGATLLIAIGTGCYVGLLSAPEPTNLPRERQSAVDVRWSDPRAGDIARLQAQLSPARVLAVREDAGGALALGTTCRRLAATVDWVRCRERAIEPRSAARLAVLTGRPPATPVRLAPLARPAAAALVVGSAPLRELEERTRVASQQTLTAWSVDSPLAQLTRPPPLNRWLAAGLETAVIALTLAGLLLNIDAVLRARRSTSVLHATGMSRRQHNTLEWMLFALPFWTIGALSAATGLLFTALFVSVTEAPVPIVWIATVLGLGAAGGLIGASTVAYVAHRDTAPGS
jgi:hypothetical protein